MVNPIDSLWWLYLHRQRSIMILLLGEPQMATQAAPTKATPTKATRAKKGEGPIVVKFLNSKNEETKRTDAETESLRIHDNSGKSKDYSITKLSLPTLRQLALDSLKRKVISAAVSGSKNGNADVIKITDSVYDNVLNGKIYIRAEGGGKPGRKFDSAIWAAAMLRTSEIKSKMPNSKTKVFTQKVIADFRTKLDTMPEKDRKVLTAKLQNDAVFKRALLEVRAEQVKGSASEFDALSAI